ncbi:outer membrane protein assembly factor BamD [Rhodobacteraceae bacterium S2214]|nr:outer membrane protein assembly factor BamD [Rhodobacteraceae bacterium S2214]
MRRFLTIATVIAITPLTAFAQDGTLADIRQQLSVLYSDINGLKGELSTTGALTTGTAGNTPLDRLNAIEAELQRLTSKTEELEFRVNRITVDGTNRIGDLEFRLCELEEGCDIGQLGDTPSLGGVDNGANVPAATPAPATGGPALAVGEQADFERAQEALAQGDFRSAADLLATFNATYPGSPVSQQAELLRGKALDGLGDTTAAARAYLQAFSGNPQGQYAPEALLKLGVALGAVGQVQDGCITLAEVGLRFPGDPSVLESQSAMRNLGCS